MELLNFIFKDIAHFIGTIILIAVVSGGIAEIVKSFKK